MLGKKISELKGQIGALERRVEELARIVGELHRPTVSKMTSSEKKPLTAEQILDEWLNGAKDNS